MRAHRSFIVNLEKNDSIYGMMLKIGKEQIPESKGIEN